MAGDVYLQEWGLYRYLQNQARRWQPQHRWVCQRFLYFLGLAADSSFHNRNYHLNTTFNADELHPCYVFRSHHSQYYRHSLFQISSPPAALLGAVEGKSPPFISSATSSDTPLPRVQRQDGRLLQTAGEQTSALEKDTGWTDYYQYQYGMDPECHPESIIKQINGTLYALSRFDQFIDFELRLREFLSDWTSIEQSSHTAHVSTSWDVSSTEKNLRQWLQPMKSVSQRHHQTSASLRNRIQA